MNTHMGVLPIQPLQFPLNVGSRLMRLKKRDAAIHPDMYLYGIMIADATCTQMVGFADSIHRQDDPLNLFFRFLGKGFLQQFPDARDKRLERHLDNKQADDDRRNRVEHCPGLAQQDGSAYARGRANG